MSFFPADDPAPGDRKAADLIDLMIVPRSSDIGGFRVNRALPTAKRRMVGPFIFFDRMGPARLEAGQGMDVRPHPHIGLSTVTYLFDGEIRHRDSLGTDMVIAPNDLNLMTAGRGIVHSERTPEDKRSGGMDVSGLQTWLALPDRIEDMAPAFEHRAARDLPTFADSGFSGRLIMGEMAGLVSPVTRHADTLYADLAIAPNGRFPLGTEAEERAVYILSGALGVAGEWFSGEKLLVFRPGDRITLEGGPEGCRLALFGGAAFNAPRYIWWNFVSSSKEKIEQAKEEWRSGRFDIVPGDEEEFVPLPER